ncbi:hypothetical protein C8J56DRAFT_740434, partial [Mycena floridula]
SPYSQVLFTNFSPLDHQAQHIRSLCSSYRAEVSRIDEALRNTVRVLTNRLDELQWNINAHSLLLAPIRRVPVDIFSEIFSHCIPENLEIFGSSSAPLLLSHVCKAWRSMALGNPRLWQ